MIDITWFDRDTKREDFDKVYRVMRKVGDRGNIVDESLLAERQQLQQTIAKYKMDDVVCLVESGRDCDCVEYTHSQLIEKATVMKVWSRQTDIYSWAEGSCYVGYCSPDERPGNYSRDLVMEAYENGHPHYVTSATV